jgi:hypothetical protein
VNDRGLDFEQARIRIQDLIGIRVDVKSDTTSTEVPIGGLMARGSQNELSVNRMSRV